MWSSRGFQYNYKLNSFCTYVVSVGSFSIIELKMLKVNFLFVLRFLELIIVSINSKCARSRRTVTTYSNSRATITSTTQLTANYGNAKLYFSHFYQPNPAVYEKSTEVEPSKLGYLYYGTANHSNFITIEALSDCSVTFSYSELPNLIFT